MNATNPRTRSSRVVLALLLLAYIFNFLDRQILGILAQPIKADLHLSDTEFGAIGGLAFALLYSVLGVPLAYLADRTSRSAVIAGSLAVSPNQRVLEIVTGAEARKRLPDRSAKLAALSMAAAFGGGDLAGGIVTGLAQLAEHAGKAAPA